MRDDSSAAQTQLLRRIAAQDKLALAELYDQVVGVLFAISLRILGDPHEAEEVIQDVFVQIWNHAALFDATLGEPIHWALRIARNRSIDRLRSRQRRAEALDRFHDLAAFNTVSDPTPANASLTEDELVAVRAAVNGLPPDQRLALEMAFFGGLTHTEIARTMNEPLGTVKARIRRGLLKLRDSLQAYS
jgi:RNA polymerase sigma-70 factor (ECF subfamily)